MIPAAYQERVAPDDAAVAAESAILYEIGTLVVERRRSLLAWGGLGAVATALVILLSGREYVARTTFVAQGSSDAAQLQGLRGLAGQFGVAIPAGGGGALYNPSLLAQLAVSPTILGVFATDTVAVAFDREQRRVALLDLLEIDPGPLAVRREKLVRAMSDLIKVDVAKETGLLTVDVRTKWPEVSVALARRLTEEVVAYQTNLRRGQASLERRFVEGRLASQRKDLAAAEERLAAFTVRNRDFTNSPGLRFEQDRLRRDVELQQQILTGLAQSREEALIREVRDIPNITVVEPPIIPARPEPRGLLRRTIFGGFAGVAVGAFVVAVLATWRRLEQGGDAPAAKFFRTLGEATRLRRTS